MNLAKGNIGNALHSTAAEHVVAESTEIYDQTQKAYQNELNTRFAKAASVMVESWLDTTPTNSILDGGYAYDESAKKLYRYSSTTSSYSEVIPSSDCIYVDTTGNKMYRWGGATDGMVATSAADAPAAIYNATVEDPINQKPGYEQSGGFYEITSQTPEKSAAQSAWDKGKVTAGLIISFKISATVWKTYQYTGDNTNYNTWTNPDSWQDFGSLAKGSEGYININQLLGDPNVNYTLSSALQSLQNYEQSNNVSYAKFGMIISYFTDYENGVVETKLYMRNSTSDFYTASAWGDFGGGAAVGNIYNVTNEEPLEANQYYTLTTAIAKAWQKGFAHLGLEITFAVSESKWKRYQYKGTTVNEILFKTESNWIDEERGSGGNGAMININELCGSPAGDEYYNLSSAVSALQQKGTTDGVNYIVSGLVITYLSEEATFTTYQFVGDATDDSQVGSPEYWKDFGAGGGGSSTAVTVVSIRFESGSISRAAGTSVTAYANVQSTTVLGTTSSTNFISKIEVLDRTTNSLLLTKNYNNRPSSGDGIYDFEIELTSLFATSGTKNVIFKATDDAGNTGTRNITLNAVDVTIVSSQTLNYTANTALNVGGGAKSLSMYQFPTNVSSQGILVTTEAWVGGKWQVLGTATVFDTYTKNISINPSALTVTDSEGVRSTHVLTHGALHLRIHGEDVASGVVGNYLWTDVMVIDNTRDAPVVVSRWYTNEATGRLQRYETLNIEYAAYGKSISQQVDIYENSILVKSETAYRSAPNSYTQQVVSDVTDGSESITVKFVVAYTSGDATYESESSTTTIVVLGSVIDAALTDGAIYAFDFANRSNSDADHSIESGIYSMTVVGSNWSSNGFGEYLERRCLAVKENVEVSLNHTPFAAINDVESNGFAMLLQFASEYALNDDDKLMECYDANGGAGFYITGNKVGIYCTTGTPSVAERRYPSGKAITVGITVDPKSVYIDNGGVRYSMMRLYLDGDLVGCVAYRPNQNPSALAQANNIQWHGENANFYLYYMLAWNSYPAYRQMFYNYLVKLTNINAIMNEYEFEHVFGDRDYSSTPVADELYNRGMAYVVESPLGTFFGDYPKPEGSSEPSQNMDEPDLTTSTKENTYIDLYYYNPSMPWRNFVSVNTRRRNQGTTSTKRPKKNSRYYLEASKGTGSYRDGATHLYSIAYPRDFNNTETDAQNRSVYLATLTPEQKSDFLICEQLLAKNKVRVGKNTIPVDIITIKIDFSDSTNANDSGVCNMMNATYRALGSEYLTPAQRYFDGTWEEGDVSLTGLQMNHSTATHPVAVFRNYNPGGNNSLKMYSKGSWKEDKGENLAIGFYGTPGYNQACHSYQDCDFVEWVAPNSVNAIGNASTPGSAVHTFINSFASGSASDQSAEKDIGKLYLITLYCDSSYRFYRYDSSRGLWYDSTGNMKQVDGVWTVTGDVLNPVDGYELLKYDALCWFRGVTQVSDMMTPDNDGLPLWMSYFESMVDNDDLTALYEMGKKVPYWLYRFLKWTSAQGDINGALTEAQKTEWCTNGYHYMNVKAVMAYDATTDYNALVDQQSKNFQPMFFLDDGGEVRGGDYVNENKERMYPNKVYDADGANGKDNETVASVAPEVDPNKMPNAETGYNNPYAGYNSVLWRNIHLTREQGMVYNDAGDTVKMTDVVGDMRALNVTLDSGFTGSPFSPAGAKHFFIDNICKKWQKTVSAYDGEVKFIQSKELDSSGNETGVTYFKSLYGLRLTELDDYITTRWRIRDGFYGCGDFTSSRITFRMGKGIAGSDGYPGLAGITIRAAKSGYFGIGYERPGSVSESVYLEAGETYRFTLFSHNDNSDTYIYQPDRLSELDLSEIVMTSDVSFLNCKLMKRLLLGSATHSETVPGTNAFITNPTLGELPFLEELDIRHTHIQIIDASGCPRLKELYATGCALETLTLAETSPITTVQLPGTIKTLALKNLPLLSYTGNAASDGLTITSLSNLKSLTLGGSPNIDMMRLLSDIVAAGALLTSVVGNLGHVTGSKTILDAIKASYLASNSTSCDTLTGRWLLTSYESDSTITSLQNFYTELELHNLQYTMIVQDDTVTDPRNVRNLENGTGCDIVNHAVVTEGDGVYTPSGHILAIMDKRYPVTGKHNSQTGRWEGRKISKTNYKQLADGSSIDNMDPIITGNDTMMYEPHYWYKGINDFKNNLKYTCFSVLTDEPLSTSTVVRRSLLGALSGTVENVAVMVENITVGSSRLDDAGVLEATSINANTYRFPVEGMKQVRWPGLNRSNIGVCFVNTEGVIVGKFNMAVNNSDFDDTIGDYIFIDVPDDAVEFIFTAKNGNIGYEVIAVDSVEIEAIEPDWVAHEPCLGGIYHASIDTDNQIRSLSGTTKRVANSSSAEETTSSEWNYDNATGNPTNTPLNPMRYTGKDFQNLSRRRGFGNQLFDYEMSKDVALLFIAKTGNRDARAVCGIGANPGTYLNGHLDSMGMKDTDGSQGGNKVMGYEDFVSVMWEFMDNIACNVSSWEEAYKRKMIGNITYDPIDTVFHIYNPKERTERTIKGLTTSGSSIERTRHGRYCDILPSKVTADSFWTKWYTDAYYYSAEPCRCVGRSNGNADAYGGVVCASAYYAFSRSFTSFGSRLAFRGEIVITD